MWQSDQSSLPQDDACPSIGLYNITSDKLWHKNFDTDVQNFDWREGKMNK